MLEGRSPPRFVTLVLLTAFSTLSLNMFLPSLVKIADDLETDYATASIAIGGFLAITAVVQLIVGPLSDRLGRRPVLMGCLFAFALASIGCSLATDVWVFLAFRMLQGGMISGYTLSLAIIRDTTPEQKAAGLIGYISMSVAIAPMLGPMVGGFLDTAFGWRSIFQFYTLCGFALLLLCWFDLGETKPAASASPEAAPERTRDLLLEPVFWAYSLCSTFAVGAFYIFITGVPLVAQLEFGISTAQLGFFIGTISAGFMLGSFLSGRYAPIYNPVTMMLAGRILACFGLLAGIAVFLLGQLSPLLFFSCTVFVGLGNGITIPSSSASAMSVRPKLAGAAAGLSGAMIVAGGAMLTTATSASLPEMNTSLALLGMMLVATLASLASVFVAVYLNRKSAHSNP
ncbi:MAG: Bcr/CflA family efflux MFS transporter [Pseudomonadota bacterium]